MKLTPAQEILIQRLIARGMPVERACKQARKLSSRPPQQVAKAR